MPQHDGLEGGVSFFRAHGLVDQLRQRAQEILPGRRLWRQAPGKRLARVFDRHGQGRGRAGIRRPRCRLGRGRHAVAARDGAQDRVQQQRGGRQRHRQESAVRH
ncbi:hypothetical protein D3C72_1832950 [compost metagenome]